MLGVMAMALRWILKRLTKGSQSTGLWGYLASRDHNKSRIELEKTRTSGTLELLQHLPFGAILREGTSDGWREIQMPSIPPRPLFVLPTEPKAGERLPGNIPAAAVADSPESRRGGGFLR